jgi:hypothetical protein
MCLAAGCVRATDGAPVAGDAGRGTPSSAAAPTAATPTTPYGVVPTLRAPIPPDTVTCAPPVQPAVTATARIGDPQAPIVTVAVPAGWTASPGSGDVGARLDGPDGMFATVAITATPQEAGAAFDAYVDRLIGDSAISSVSVLPAELCDYSGQKLLGALADVPQTAVEFRDRIVDIWTNTQTYLVAVHVQAPTDVAGFDEAASQLTEDFEVRIP